MTDWMHGEMRVSDRERRLSLRRLQRAHARGRISAAELEERSDAVRTARSYGDLVPLFADLLPVRRGPVRFRRGPFPFGFPLLPLLIIGIVIAATGHVPWLPIIVAGVLLLVFAPWRPRRWGHRGWVHRDWAS